jgi:Uma2 family endonuclease
MVNTAIHGLTFEKYLTYDDGTDHHYELVDGCPVLMNPPTIEHFLMTRFLEQGLDAEI